MFDENAKPSSGGGDDDLPDLSKVAVPVKAPKDLDVPGVVDDELQKLGYPDQARLAIIANMGRENSWNPSTIFSGHNDPANGARNQGLVSWQGDRRDALVGYVQQNGGDWSPNERNLRLQAQFMDNELKSKYPSVYSTLQDPGAQLPAVSKALRGYIRYNPGPPYNTPDGEYDVQANRKWGEEAARRGIGLPDLSGVANLPDLSQAAAPTTTTPQTQAPPMPSTIAPPTMPAPDQQQFVSPSDVQTPDEQKANLLQTRQTLSDALSRAKTPERRDVLTTRLKSIDSNLLQLAQQTQANAALPADPNAAAPTNAATNAPGTGPGKPRPGVRLQPQPQQPQQQPQMPADTGDGYQEWLGFMKLDDSAANRQAYDLQLKSAIPASNADKTTIGYGLNKAQTDQGDVDLPRSAEQQRSEANNVAPVEAARPYDEYAADARAKGQTPMTPATYRKQTENKILASSYHSYTVPIDLASDPKATFRRAISQVAADRGLPQSAVDKFVAERSGYGYLADDTPATAEQIAQEKKNGNKTFNVTVDNATVNDLLKSSGEKPDGDTAIVPSLATDIGMKSAQYRAQNQAPNLSLNPPVYDQAEANVAANPFSGGTDEEIKAERERLKRTELSDAEQKNAVSLGDFVRGVFDSPGAAAGLGGNANAELAGGAASGLITSVGGRGSELLSGLYKYSLPGILDQGRSAAGLGDPHTADAITKFANEAKVVGVSSKGDGLIYDVGNVGGQFAGDAPRLIALTALSGGNPIVAFGADEFLRSAGRGESVQDQVKNGVSGVAFGAIFHGANRLASAVEEGLTEAVLPKQNILRVDPNAPGETIARSGDLAPEGFSPGYKAKADVELIAKLAGEAVRVGSIGTGGFAMGKLQGQSNKEALYQTGLMMLTDLGFNHAKYGNMADLGAKVFRLYKNGEYADLLVGLSDAAKEGRGTQAEIYDVTGKVPARAVQAVISDDDLANARNITPPKRIGTEEPKASQGFGSGVSDNEWQKIQQDSKAAVSKKAAEETPIARPSEPLTADTAVESGQKVDIDGRGQGVVREDRGKNVLVDFNPVEKNGETKYQSSAVVRKTQLTLTPETDGAEKAASPSDTPAPSTEQASKSESNDSTSSAAKPAPSAENQPGSVHTFSSTQANLPDGAADIVKYVGRKLIPDSEIYTDPEHSQKYGREQEPHVTIKYGIHSPDSADVEKALANEKPFTAKLGKISIFDGKGDTPYDVVKADVDSPDLHRLNDSIAKGTKVTDTFPEYKPHVTLAYVKKGEGKKYVGRTDLEGMEVPVNSVSFSGKNGNNVDIPLGSAKTDTSESLATDAGMTAEPSEDALDTPGGLEVGKYQPKAAKKSEQVTGDGDATASPTAMAAEANQATAAEAAPEQPASKAKEVAPASREKRDTSSLDNHELTKREFTEKYPDQEDGDTVDGREGNSYKVRRLAKGKWGSEDLASGRVRVFPNKADMREFLHGDATHKRAVARAVCEGREVDTNVLAEYPSIERRVNRQNADRLFKFQADPRVADVIHEVVQGGRGKLDRPALDELAREHNVSPDEAEGIVANADTAYRRRQDRGRGQREEGSRPATHKTLEGKPTQVEVADSKKVYDGKYELREVADLHPSHNAFNFNPNEEYFYKNDRHYDKGGEEAGDVIQRSMPNEFNPAKLVNNAPTAELGAPIIDVDGNALGGNSRAMMLHRIYGAENPKARDAYLSKLREDAPAYGIDPEDIAKFDHPVLVRKVTDSGYDRQQAITDFNRVSAKALKKEEQAIAEGGNLTPEALDFITSKIRQAGSDATPTDLASRYGTDIIDELIKQGVLSKSDRNTFVQAGEVTGAGRDRIKQMLTGHVFADLEQMQYLPDSYRDALGRTVLPLIRTEKNPDWDLVPATREALDLLTEHSQKGKKQEFDEFTRQTSTLQPEGWSDRAIAIAHKLREGVQATASAFNTYAGEFRNADEGSMFGALSPDQAFDTAFKDGSLKSVADEGDDIPLKSLYTDDGELDHEKIEDIGRRIEDGGIQLKRIDQEGFREQGVRSRIHAEASVVVGAAEAASPSYPESDEELGGAFLKTLSWAEHKRRVERQEQALESYAKARGIWHEPGSFSDKLYISRGVEARVYRSPDEPDTVIKVVGYDNVKQTSPQQFLDRLAIFNYLFPDTRYDVTGFTRDEDGFFQFVVSQPYIKADLTKPDLTETQVGRWMKETLQAFPTRLPVGSVRGYASLLYNIGDTHGGNVIRGEDDETYIIDAVPWLNEETGSYQPLTLQQAAQPDDIGGSLKSIAELGDSPAFYSQAERTIEEKMPARASDLQVRQILSAKNGIKQEELEWLGINDWLKDHPKPTKDEVLSFIRDNNVQLQEVVKGQQKREWIDKDGSLRTPDGEFWIDDDGNRYQLNQKGFGPVATAYNVDTLKERANHFDVQSPTKYSGYTLPGGENYREMLLTLPAPPEIPAKPAGRIERLAGNGRYLVEVAGLQRHSFATKEEAEAHLNDVTQRLDRRSSAEKMPSAYLSPHWPEPNPIVHLRFDDRDDSRTLHIAEIQSDWHQTGRDRGYQKTFDPNKVEVEKITAGEDDIKDEDLRSQFPEQPEPRFRLGDTVYKARYVADADTTGWMYGMSKDQAAGAIKKLFDDHIKGKNKVPDAPFKKIWHELALKRALRYAAEHGYDRLTWDAGDTVADRFNLSHHVDEIHWEHRGLMKDGKRQLVDVGIKPKNGESQGLQVVDGVVDKGPAGMEGQHLADVLGKAVAEKILADEKGSLSGVGLRIGGTGMRGFYDKILPSFVNKYVKKWGGSVTDDRVLVHPTAWQRYHDLRIEERPKRSVDDANIEVVATNATGNPETIEVFHARPAAEQYVRDFEREQQRTQADKYAGGQTSLVHSVEITPAMRSSVLRGQPLYKVRDPESQALLQRVLPKAALQDVAEGLSGGTLTADSDLELNEHDAELLRRFLQVIDGRKHKAFDGILFFNGQGERLALEAGRFARQLKAADYPKPVVEAALQLSQNLDKLIKLNRGTGVGFVFEDALPEEKFHQEQILAKGIDPRAVDDLKQLPLWDASPKFARQYDDVNDVARAFELVAKLATGQESDYGWGKVPDFETERQHVYDAYINGVIRKNADNIREVGLDTFFNEFPRLKRVYEEAESGQGSGTTEGESPAGAEPVDRSGEAEVGSPLQPDAESERAGGSGDDRAAERTGEAEPTGPADAGTPARDQSGEPGRDSGADQSHALSEKPLTVKKYDQPDNVTGLRNSIIDEEREKRGLPPAMQAAARAFGPVWREAMDEIENSKGFAAVRLIDTLRDNPRPLSDKENALLLQRQIELQNAHDQALSDLTNAADGYDIQELQEATAREAAVSDALLEVYNINKAVGTENARGLGIRRLMAKEDYSLTKLIARERAARDGDRLSDAQRSKLEDLSREMNEALGRIDEAERRIEELKNDNAALETENAEIAAALGDERGVAKDHEGVIQALRRQIASMKRGAVAAVHPAARTTATRELLNRRSDIVARLRQKFPEGAGALKAVAGDEPAEPLDAETRKDLVDYAAIEILDGKPYQDVLETLDGLTKGRVTGDEIRAIHADAVDLTRGERRPASSEVKEKLKTRREHIAQARRYRNVKAIKDADKFKDTDLNKLEREILARTDDDRLGVAAVLTNQARNRGEWYDLIKDFYPDLKGAERDKLYVDAFKKRADVRGELQKQRIENARDIELTDAEYRRAKNEGLTERSRAARQRGTIERHFQQLTRTRTDKFWDALAEWRRGALLSSPVVLGKLTGAAISRMTFTPVEEGVGTVFRVIPGIAQIAKQAPRHGAVNLEAEYRALASALTTGMRDAWQTLRTGKSDLDLLYGKPVIDGHILPVIRYFGHLHGMLKAPVKRAEFERSLTKRLAFAAAHGADVTNDAVQMTCALDAYKDANRSIFMQDNWVSQWWNGGLARLEARDRDTGKTDAGKKVLATMFRILLPIVKVPTNIVAETVESSPVGLLTAAAKTAKALIKGAEKLTPDEADVIMREFKKGSLGTAFLLLGYFFAGAVGGFYQPGDKRKYGDVRWGKIRVPHELVPDWALHNFMFGDEMDLPSWALHNPLFELMQMGATIRRVSDTKFRKKDEEPQGLGTGIQAGAWGLADEVPFVREMTELDKARDPNTRDQFFGELGKSILVPQLSQWIATQTDHNADGYTIKRKPQNFIQYLESGVPGLRKDVPEQPVRKNMAPDQLKSMRDAAGPEQRAAIDDILNAKKGMSDELRQKVREGKMSIEDFGRELDKQLEAGKITKQEYTERLESAYLPDTAVEIKTAAAVTDDDFRYIESLIKEMPEGDREPVYQTLLKKVENKLESKDLKSQREAERLMEIVKTHFGDLDKPKQK